MTLRNNSGAQIWRAIVVGLAVLSAVLAFQASAAGANAFTCRAEDRTLVDTIRPGSTTQCVAGITKPAYELVCQDDGLHFGCCRSACDCKFTMRAFGNKGWGAGTRAYKNYQIGGSCPRPPSATLPDTVGGTVK
jgi:hypothetical protein